jgi:hypothetical protein
MPKKLTIRIDDKPDAVVIGNSEMAGILANEQLVKRLRKGSRNAKRKNGTFIVRKTAADHRSRSYR